MYLAYFHYLKKCILRSTNWQIPTFWVKQVAQEYKNQTRLTDDIHFPGLSVLEQSSLISSNTPWKKAANALSLITFGHHIVYCLDVSQCQLQVNSHTWPINIVYILYIMINLEIENKDFFHVLFCCNTGFSWLASSQLTFYVTTVSWHDHTQIQTIKSHQQMTRSLPAPKRVMSYTFHSTNFSERSQHLKIIASLLVQDPWS